MKGTIGTRDVLVHGFTIVRHFGLAAYLRCVRALFRRNGCTFLGVLYQDDRRDGPHPQAD